MLPSGYRGGSGDRDSGRQFVYGRCSQTATHDPQIKIYMRNMIYSEKSVSIKSIESTQVFWARSRLSTL